MKIVVVILAGMSAAVFAADGTANAARDNLPAQIATLSARIARLSEHLQQITTRTARAHTTVPTPEEFRQQVANGRKKVEAMRARVNQQWKDVKQLADTRSGAQLDARVLKAGVPQPLVEDAEFQQARESASAAAARLETMEKRLIDVMLVTAFEESAPAGQTVPDSDALAREWANLSAQQKALTATVEDAARKAAASKLAFDASALFAPDLAPGAETNRALLDAREKVRAQLETREATADLVASREFFKAVGPAYAKWK